MSTVRPQSSLKKDEFIKQASANIQYKLDYYSSQSAGKEYQDALIRVLSTATISVPSQFSSEQSNKNLLVAILTEIPLIDDELYSFFIKQRIKYLQYKPLGKTREEYIRWTKMVEESIAHDPKLRQFAKKRVINNHQREQEQLQQYLEWLDRQRLRLDVLMSDEDYKALLSPQNQEFLQQAVGELREMRVGYDDRYEIYHETGNRDINTYHLVEKLGLVLKKYILSRNHADKNLRSAYIEIFLGKKLEKAVKFEKWTYHLNFLKTQPFNAQKLEQLLQGYEKRGVQLSLFDNENTKKLVNNSTV